MLLNASVKTDWVVYCKRPFGGPRQVLKYLARYTHRVAISNSRLVEYKDKEVHFRWKDYRDGNKVKTMKLNGIEFIRRILLHVLPSGFVRIRHYGFLSNRNRSNNLDQCRRLLGVKQVEIPTVESDKSTEHTLPGEVDDSSNAFPECKIGKVKTFTG